MIVKTTIRHNLDAVIDKAQINPDAVIDKTQINREFILRIAHDGYFCLGFCGVVRGVRTGPETESIGRCNPCVLLGV